jgi:hypothetical protein
MNNLPIFSSLDIRDEIILAIVAGFVPLFSLAAMFH